MVKTKKILCIIIAVVLVAILSVTYAVLFSQIEEKNKQISELKEENVRLTSIIQRNEKEFNDKITELEKENNELKEDSTKSDEQTNSSSSNKEEFTISSLDNALNNQEVRIISTKYVVRDTKHKALYPDALQVIITNESEYDIKDAVIAFVAWDKNNLPVKIKGSIDFSDGAYIRKVNYGDINLVPNDTFGSSSGYEIDENCGIVTFKAIVVSYETFNGKTWENPLYNDWCKLYEGKKLTNIPE